MGQVAKSQEARQGRGKRKLGTSMTCVHMKLHGRDSQSDGILLLLQELLICPGVQALLEAPRTITLTSLHASPTPSHPFSQHWAPTSDDLHRANLGCLWEVPEERPSWDCQTRVTQALQEDPEEDWTEIPASEGGSCRAASWGLEPLVRPGLKPICWWTVRLVSV